jgi:hypothetical protein
MHLIKKGSIVRVHHITEKKKGSVSWQSTCTMPKRAIAVRVPTQKNINTEDGILIVLRH